MSAICITGRLTANAQARVTPDGMAQLRVELAAPALPGQKPLQVRAVQLVGTGPAAAMVASANAHHLRRGARLELQAQRLHMRRGVAHLDGLERLHCPDLPNTHHQETDR
jgi:hypothetical protein